MFCSFQNDICICFILNPKKKQAEQRFYESFGSQGFRFQLKVWKEKKKHLHIHRLSFCLYFLTFQQNLYWIFTCDFWIWPLCTFTDRISQTRGEYFCCMQWHKEVIAVLIAFYFIHFHKLNVNLGNMNWLDTFFFFFFFCSVYNVFCWQ